MEDNYLRLNSKDVKQVNYSMVTEYFDPNGEIEINIIFNYRPKCVIEGYNMDERIEFRQIYVRAGEVWVPVSQEYMQGMINDHTMPTMLEIQCFEYIDKYHPEAKGLNV